MDALRVGMNDPPAESRGEIDAEVLMTDSLSAHLEHLSVLIELWHVSFYRDSRVTQIQCSGTGVGTAEETQNRLEYQVGM